MKLFKPLFALLLVAGLLTACDDNPVDGEDGDHFEAFGIAVRAEDGTLLYRWYDEQGINCDQTPCQLVLPAGGEEHFVVQFLDEDENVIEHLGDEQFMEVDVADETIAEVEEHHEDDGEEHEAMEFTLVGKQAGSTTLVVEVIHGEHDHGGEEDDDDHADFESQAIDVVVTQ